MSPSLFAFRVYVMSRIHKIVPLVTVVVFVLLHVFAYPGTRFANDSYRYARSAYEFLGAPHREAQDKALRAYCADTAAMLQRNRDRKSTRLNSSHLPTSRMPSSA